jgi:hypothetical protein
VREGGEKEEGVDKYGSLRRFSDSSSKLAATRTEYATKWEYLK